jgi:putative transposase
MARFIQKAEIMDLCTWSCIPRSVYYYRNREGKPGVRPSTHTFKLDGSRVENQEVIEEIKKILQDDFVTYGYDLVNEELRDKQYIINPKKTYRLMDENNLLLGKRIHTTGKRDFVRFRKINATYPMEHLCMDIKYVWVEGEKRNYYLLTVLDVFSRKAVEWIFLPSIRKYQVIGLFMRLSTRYDVKGVTVRNDNGSQFIANNVRKYLRELEMKQEFSHISTPQDNGYIEAFFSNLRRDVLNKNVFESYYEAKFTIEAYMSHYNLKRKHRGIGKITPQQKWELGMTEKLKLKNESYLYNINSNINPNDKTVFEVLSN